MHAVLLPAQLVYFAQTDLFEGHDAGQRRWTSWDGGDKRPRNGRVWRKVPPEQSEARRGVTLGASLSGTFLHGTSGHQGRAQQSLDRPRPPGGYHVPTRVRTRPPTPTPPGLALNSNWKQRTKACQSCTMPDSGVLCERVLKIVSKDPSNAQGHVLKTNHTFKTAPQFQTHASPTRKQKAEPEGGTLLIYRTSLWSNPLSHVSWLKMENPNLLPRCATVGNPFLVHLDLKTGNQQLSIPRHMTMETHVSCI